MIRFVILAFSFYFLSACKKEAIDPTADQFVETEYQSLHAVTEAVNDDIGGFYYSVPIHYEVSKKHYPLIVFIHGAGQYGNGKEDLPKVLSDAIPELVAEGIFPPNFCVNGKNYSFIIMVPQFRWRPYPSEVESFIKYVKRHYRVDSTRMYLAGLSQGGSISCEVAAAYPSLFAAILPMAGVEGNEEKCKKLAEGKVAIWLFHNDHDTFVPINASQEFFDLVNSFQPAIPPRFTIFPAFGLYGHDAWTKACNPRYRENNRNIYEWMLQYSK